MKHYFPAATILGVLVVVALGVTWIQAGVPGDSLSRALETIEKYGQQVIARA